jgi:hypothetical protein
MYILLLLLQARVDELYRKPEKWNRMSIMMTAGGAGQGHVGQYIDGQGQLVCRVQSQQALWYDCMLAAQHTLCSVS